MAPTKCSESKESTIAHCHHQCSMRVVDVPFCAIPQEPAASERATRSAHGLQWGPQQGVLRSRFEVRTRGSATPPCIVSLRDVLVSSYIFVSAKILTHCVADNTSSQLSNSIVYRVYAIRYSLQYSVDPRATALSTVSRSRSSLTWDLALSTNDIQQYHEQYLAAHE